MVSYLVQGDCGFTECLRSVHSSLLEESEEKQFFFVCVIIFACETIWSCTFVYRVLFKGSFLFLKNYRFYFTSSDGSVQLSISVWFNFGGLYLSRKLFISSRLSNLLAYIVHSILFILFFWFSAVSDFWYSLFKFLILFGFFHFSFWWTWPEAFNFLYTFKVLDPWFYWIFVLFFSLFYLFPPWSLIFPSFSWL